MEAKPSVMRIAFFTDRFQDVYGGQENLLLLARLAQDRGHSVVVCTTRVGEFSVEAEGRGLQTAIVEIHDGLHSFEAGGVRRSGKRRAIQNAVGAVQFSQRLDQALRQHDVELLVTGAVRSSLLTARSRVSRQVRTMMFVQNSIPMGAYGVVSLIGVDLVALIAGPARATFPESALKLLRPRMAIMHSGRDLSRYRGPSARTPSSTLRLVSVCSITYRKGLDTVLAAMALLAKRGIRSKLVVVGDTVDAASVEHSRQLKDQVSSFGLDVDFAGWQDDVVPFLRDADAFVLGSRHEGLPGVLIEAMACGLPCVSTDAGGSAEAVLDGRTGFVVPVDDESQMADRLWDLADGDVRRRMGERAAAWAEKEFGLDAFGRRFEDLAHDCLRSEANSTRSSHA